MENLTIGMIYAVKVDKENVMKKTKRKPITNQTRISRSFEQAEKSSLAFFLKEINNIPMMTREQEEKTTRELAANSKELKDKLINSNLRFVINIAKQYKWMGILFEDLISEGNVGLITAANHFNPEKNCRLISYAAQKIQQSILNALDLKSRTIRLPHKYIIQLRKIEKAKEMKEIFKKNSLSESEIREVAKFLNMDKEFVSNLLIISRSVLSLEIPIHQYSKTMLKDSIIGPYESPETFAVNSIMKDNIDDALNTLKEREADIIRCYFGLNNIPPMTLSKISSKYNISKEQTRQIKEKALCKLRNSAHMKKLQDYCYL